MLLAVTALGADVRAAGYMFDPSAMHERGLSNSWFGSARTASGDYVSGVTIVLATNDVDFVTYTDAQGRFRTDLPPQIKPVDVTPRCSRRGYRQLRISKRTPPGNATSPVQVDCVLKR